MTPNSKIINFAGFAAAWIGAGMLATAMGITVSAVVGGTYEPASVPVTAPTATQVPTGMCSVSTGAWTVTSGDDVFILPGSCMPDMQRVEWCASWIYQGTSQCLNVEIIQTGPQTPEDVEDGPTRD